MGAGGTEKHAVSQTGSGQRLSPVMWSPPPETNRTNGHTAPMWGRSRRPTVSPGGEQDTLGLACSFHMCGGAAAEAPNKRMQVTGNSVRSCVATAIART